ncbi:MAG: DMT family transporter [Anaerolineales bacterium]|nr:DMT family transporter [Anaerolineales bacterium]MCX7753825.1 DMT family transporter [Anaerolineales bacterium]MDW8276421.1 DMT family transporter [Anaerolineales bacterium]
MKTTHHNPALFYLAIAGGILAVSTAAIFIRYAQQEVPSLVIAAVRLSLASLVLAPLALMRHRAELSALSRRETTLGLLSGFFLALHFATWISSLEFTSVASSVVLVSTTPLWVALLSPLVLRESIHRAAIVGLVLALLGGAVVGMSETCRFEYGLVCPPLGQFFQGQALWGNFLALCGAWMGAGYLLIGRRLRAKMSLISYIFLVYGMAALVLLVIMRAAGFSPFGYPPLNYLWMLLLALVPQLLGHSTFNWALRYLPASFVAVTLLGEPIGSTLLALLILGEVPSVLELVGGVLILTGIYLAARESGQ